MARTINFENRVISVPDDATDDEVASIIEASAPTRQPVATTAPVVAPTPVTTPVTQPIAVPSPPQNTLGQEAVRQMGLTARYTAEGLGSFPQMLGGAMESVGLKGAGGNIGSMFADYLGLPKPQNAMERVVASGSRAMASGLPLMKAGQVLSAGQYIPETTKAVGSVMAAQPAMQTSLAGTSGVASEMAKEGGLGEGAQFAAGVVAPMVALPVLSGLQGAARVSKNIVAPLVSEKAAERGAAKLAIKATAGRSEQVARGLGAAEPQQTAGQVAAAIDNADLAALQSLANSNDATLADTIKKGVDLRLKTARSSLENRLSPVRDEAITLARQGGVDIKPILNRIDVYRSASGNMSDDVLQNATGEIRSKLAKLTESGSPDPAELHTIRKQLSSTIAKYSKESADWDKKKASKVERVLQLAIDDALDKAVSKADPTRSKLWSENYMGEYAKGSKLIRTAEEGLERESQLASKAIGSVRGRVTGAENPVQGVNLLSRIATITNTIIRAAEGAAGTKVEKALTRMMAPDAMGGDKAKLGKLMMAELNRPPSFIESMKYTKGPSRAQLGYGIEDMATPEVITPPPQQGFQLGKGAASQPPALPKLQLGYTPPPTREMPNVPFSQPVTPADVANRVRVPNTVAAERYAEQTANLSRAKVRDLRKSDVPAGSGMVYDLDPITGRLRPADQGVKGATPEIFMGDTGANLKSASNKVASGQGFNMTAAEKVAWDRTSVDIKTVSPDLAKLSDKQIMSKMADREWVQSTIDKANQKAEMFAQLERQSQDRIAQSMARIQREKMLDIAEQLQEALGSRPSSRGYTQGDKTRKFQRGLLTDLGEPK